MNTSDYSITNHADKYSYYESESDIRYSNLLKRWLCFDRCATQEILSNHNFEVHDYDLSEISNRFKVDLKISQEILKHLPLSHEGNEHLFLRKKYIEFINLNIKAALEHFKKKILEIQFQPGSIDLIPFIHNAIIESNAILAGLDPKITAVNFVDVGLVFDDTTSLKKRIVINNIFVELVNLAPSSLSYEDKIFRVALLTVGVNALLAAISESLLNSLLIQPKGYLDQILWEDSMPAAGIAILERTAKQDIKICNHLILAGQTIRCYVENLGFESGRKLKFHPGYFAAPSRHSCPGMKYSLEIWRIIKENLFTTHSYYQLLDYRYRSNDPVFNFPSQIRINLESKNT